jgi:hypothetical protein
MCFNHIVERGLGSGKIISCFISKVGEVGFETFGSGQGSQTSIIEVTNLFARLQDVLKCMNKTITLPFYLTLTSPSRLYVLLLSL